MMFCSDVFSFCSVVCCLSIDGVCRVLLLLLRYLSIHSLCVMLHVSRCVRRTSIASTRTFSIAVTRVFVHEKIKKTKKNILILLLSHVSLTHSLLNESRQLLMYCWYSDILLLSHSKKQTRKVRRKWGLSPCLSFSLVHHHEYLFPLFVPQAALVLLAIIILLSIALKIKSTVTTILDTVSVIIWTCLHLLTVRAWFPLTTFYLQALLYPSLRCYLPSRRSV